MLFSLGVQVSLYYSERVPKHGALLVVSNHRSFLDAPLMMVAAGQSVHFACHHYMGEVPVMRDVVKALGGFPLDQPKQRSRTFFRQATNLLQAQQAVGIFPEGTDPMVRPTSPQQVGEFQRGFAHLALRAPIEKLSILPVAIAAVEETQGVPIPLQFFSWFDPSEPLFDQSGWHPAVLYRRVNLLVGQPIQITDEHRRQYQGKQAGELAAELTQACQIEVAGLLQQGYD